MRTISNQKSGISELGFSNFLAYDSAQQHEPDAKLNIQYLAAQTRPLAAAALLPHAQFAQLRRSFTGPIEIRFRTGGTRMQNPADPRRFVREDRDRALGCELTDADEVLRLQDADEFA